MFKLIILTLSIGFLYSCHTNNQQQQPGAISDSTKVDTSAIINDPKSNLNIQTNSFSEIDTSGILMFPLSMGESERDGGGSLSYKEISPSNYWNIIFYNSHTAAYHLLSERKMLIGDFDTKSSSSENGRNTLTAKNIFYTITVDDYNKDRRLTGQDPIYLFISDKEGNNFRQISPAGCSVRSWQIIQSTNKIIITVTKDSDNNKKFDESDEVASFQIDIDKEVNATEIFPADFKKKLKVLFDKDWKRIKE
jgi:hypothetical protein